MEFIFVYGTLMKAYRDLNDVTKMFHEGTEWVSDAKTTGKLYRIDWYPALVMEGNDPVYGEIYRITSPGLLSLLDQYEHAVTESEYLEKKQQGVSFTDADYVRKKRTVNTLECWIYEYIGNVSEPARIKDGAFRL